MGASKKLETARLAIEQLDKEKKSEVLLKMMGWRIDSCPPYSLIDENGFQVFVPCETELYGKPINLYASYNMYLAWRVLNWADANLKGYFALELHSWWMLGRVMGMVPTKAQAAWLDMILTLAAGSELVEVFS